MLEIIPFWEQIEVYAELAEQYRLAFEYNDFYLPDLLDDGTLLKERIRIYQSLGRPKGVDTMHGVFFDILPFSYDSSIRRQSVYRMHQSMEIAGELGCKGVVFHTNLTPLLLSSDKYKKNWLKCMRETIAALLSESGCEIYLENMFDQSPNELSELAAELRGESRFGVCLDIAHMRLATDDPREWFKVLAPYIKHFHVNDTHLQFDDHLALGQGNIDWEEIEALIEEFDLKDKNRLIEVNGLENIHHSLKYCQEAGIK